MSVQYYNADDGIDVCLNCPYSECNGSCKWLRQSIRAERYGLDRGETPPEQKHGVKGTLPLWALEEANISKATYVGLISRMRAYIREHFDHRERLARKCGLSPSDLTKILKCEKEMTMRVYFLICNGVGVKPDFFLKG